ncbi:hypothetical protein M441DRAFT_34613 [Trichoderma asperellum CBS 433.97]|uniref:Uncharacterized protein n=1 Tax=Trichoderma asperellum (strain ATCC 204424 / CBS 433.97 / NBRC 101777) TaxID=1042311 RepID=A0A2T3ZGR1_TRIA4|nr:hypothetical protein M441DRAFT_34613 [Trichoderma asperellum CBS 433.97]PTB43987.1 hypothetical protein M441DRAFT_34613 [Trichoderma asperellum CBS 433.97]
MSSLWSTAKKKVFGIHELQTQKRLPDDSLLATPRARCVLEAPKRWVGMAELIRRWLRLALGSKPGLPRGHEPGEWSFGRGGWIVSPCARALASVADPARAPEISVKILLFAYPSTSFHTSM